MNHKEIERWYRLRNMKKVAQVMVLVTVAVLVVGYTASRALKNTPEPMKLPAGCETGIRIDNFTFSAPGANPWELKAVSALVSESLDKVALNNPTVIYEGGKGGKIHLTAKCGQLDRKSSNVAGQGEVAIRYRDFVFATGSINYLHERKQAETSSQVSLEGGDLSLTGTGLKFSIENEEIVIEQDVRARLYDVRWVEPGQKLPL